MRRVLVLLALASLAATAASAAAPAAGAATRSCGFVGFAPNSDNGAFRIRATGVSCATARRVARGARETSVAPGQRYRRAGFRCRGRFDDAGLPSVRFRCTRRADGGVVRFVRS